MKNISLRADEDLIEEARAVARSQTLNTAFREWLLQFTSQSGNLREVDTLMRRLKHIRAGHHIIRDEMNKR